MYDTLERWKRKIAITRSLTHKWKTFLNPPSRFPPVLPCIKLRPTPLPQAISKFHDWLLFECWHLTSTTVVQHTGQRHKLPNHDHISHATTILPMLTAHSTTMLLMPTAHIPSVLCVPGTTSLFFICYPTILCSLSFKNLKMMKDLKMMKEMKTMKMMNIRTTTSKNVKRCFQQANRNKKKWTAVLY